MYGERRGVYRVFVRKPEVNRPFGRPWRRWENNNMDLQEVRCGGGAWIGSSWLRIRTDSGK
jgi:hypothetical protein